MDLLINTYGTRIRSSGERIILVFPNKKRGQTKKEYAARRLKKIIILRPSSISTAAVELALKHSIDIVYLGSFGKPIGRIFPSNPKGLGELRRAQLTVTNSSGAYELAKAFVRGKAQNQIDYLRELGKRYHKDLSQTITQTEAFLDSLTVVSDGDKNKQQLFSDP